MAEHFFFFYTIFVTVQNISEMKLVCNRMNFYFGMGGTPISLRQKLRMQRERMQCAGLWPVVLNVLNSYLYLQ